MLCLKSGKFVHIKCDKLCTLMPIVMTDNDFYQHYPLTNISCLLIPRIKTRAVQ